MFGLWIAVPNERKRAVVLASEMAVGLAGGSAVVCPGVVAKKSCLRRSPSNPGLRKVVSYGSVETLEISPRAKNEESEEGAGSDASSDDGSMTTRAF